MTKLYFELAEQARENYYAQQTEEYKASPEYQGVCDGNEGAEPNPELLQDRSYWLAYCKSLHNYYCKKNKSYPKELFFTPEMEQLLF